LFDLPVSILQATILQATMQTMKRKFLRTLVLVLTAFAAVSLVVCADGFREYDDVYVQGEMLKASAENLDGRRHDQMLYPAPVALAKNRYARGFATGTKSFALVSLSTCVLLC
jgi:hypothetical protein